MRLTLCLADSHARRDGLVSERAGARSDAASLRRDPAADECLGVRPTSSRFGADHPALRVDFGHSRRRSFLCAWSRLPKPPAQRSDSCVSRRQACRGETSLLQPRRFPRLARGPVRSTARQHHRRPERCYGSRSRQSVVAIRAAPCRAEGRIWDAGGTRYLLEWSATKGSHVRAIPFRAEFIRLTMRPLPSHA